MTPEDGQSVLHHQVARRAADQRAANSGPCVFRLSGAWNQQVAAGSPANIGKIGRAVPGVQVFFCPFPFRPRSCPAAAAGARLPVGIGPSPCSADRQKILAKITPAGALFSSEQLEPIRRNTWPEAPPTAILVGRTRGAIDLPKRPMAQDPGGAFVAANPVQTRLTLDRHQGRPPAATSAMPGLARNRLDNALPLPDYIKITRLLLRPAPAKDPPAAMATGSLRPETHPPGRKLNSSVAAFSRRPAGRW